MPFRTSPRRAGGFTLIELMITVAIIAILVAVAYPMYMKSVMKSRRADAKAALLDLASREERYFATNNQYTDQAPALGYGSGTTVTPAAPMPILSGSTSYYSLSVVFTAASGGSTPTAAAFTATATALYPQTNDVCGNYTLTQAGVQGVSGGTATAATCW